MAKTVTKQDFKSLYNSFKKKIEEDEILKNDALLSQQNKGSNNCGWQEDVVRLLNSMHLH